MICLVWLRSAAVHAEPAQASPASAAPGGEARPAANVAADSDEVVVTGTRIPHTSFARPLPVTVIEREAIAQSGATTLGDLLRDVPINAGSDLNLDVATVAGGTAQFNLRGLGMGATLVLLNGRRVVKSGAVSPDGENFVDINSLPLAAIERIEILKSGASAIYGSDAVAGVVNLITRRGFDGIELQASGQTTGDLAQHEWTASALFGTQGEDSRALGMISYLSREPLDADARAFTHNGQNISAVSYPSVFVPVGADGQPLGTGVYRDPACGDPALGPSTIRKGPTDPIWASTPQCWFDFNSYFMLVPEDRRVNGFGRFEHDLGGHTIAFLEGSVAHSRTRRTISPSLQLNQPVYVPADNPFNPTMQRLLWQGRVRGGASPPWEQVFDSDTVHLALGVRGDFDRIAPDSRFAQWNWELAATWGGSRYDMYSSDTSVQLLQTALGSCVPDNPETCWNPFATGRANSESLYERIKTEPRSTTDTQLFTLTLDLSGPLLELPAGDLSFAAGVQLRRESTVVRVDHLSEIGDDAFAGRMRPWAASRSISSVYGELSAPVLYGLEFQAAGRIERYDDFGSSGFNPMLGVTWTPAISLLGARASAISRVRLRATYARSFVAPSLLQTSGQHNMPAELWDTSTDPRNPARGASSVPNYVVVAIEGNPKLPPQSARVVTAGIEWNPLDALVFEADYFGYDFTNIVVAQAQQKVDSYAADPAASGLTRVGNVIRGASIQFESAERVTTHGLDLSLTDALKLGDGTLSLGVSASYLIDYWIPRADFGVLTPGSPLTQVLPGSDCDDRRCNVAGLRNRTNFARALPKLRARFPLSFTRGIHTVSGSVNLIGSYRDERRVVAAPLESGFDPIAAFVGVDLQYAVQLPVTEQAVTTLRIGIRNLLDAAPPRVRTGFGYDTETHDPRGRLAYVQLAAHF